MQTKQQKKEVVSAVAEKVKSAKSLVFVNFKGVSVKDITSVRKELGKSGSGWQVLKKTLLNIALKDAGLKADAKKFQGQIGVAFSSDEIAAAKTIVQFAKANKDVPLVIEGGALGDKELSASEIQELAKLPGKEELLAKLVGTLQAPISGFARVLNGNLSGLVRVLRAVEKQKV